MKRTLAGSTAIALLAASGTAHSAEWDVKFGGFAETGVGFAQTDLNNSTPGATVDIGANYVNSFGGFDVAVSGRWGIASDNRVAVPGTDIGLNPQIWAAGLNLSYAGFTIGGSFAEQNNSGDEDGIAYDVGVSYRAGPWGFSFTYLHGENVSDEDTSGDTGLPSVAFAAANPGLTPTEEADLFLAAVDYDLAKGVDLNLIGGYTDFDENGSIGPVTNQGHDVEGFYVATGIRIRF